MNITVKNIITPISRTEETPKGRETTFQLMQRNSTDYKNSEMQLQKKREEIERLKLETKEKMDFFNMKYPLEWTDTLSQFRRKRKLLNNDDHIPEHDKERVYN